MIPGQIHGHHHEEQHVKFSKYLKDFVLGMADGLTVPFALAAGLSGIAAAPNIIVIAGIAEIAAGTIAMGLGGYLAAKTEAEHYRAETQREEQEIRDVPEIEAEETADIFRTFNIAEEHIDTIVNSLRANPKNWRDFMLRFELGLEEPDKNREIFSPLIIGFAYTIGGLIPLSPYFFIHNIHSALNFSICITLITLFAFGALKGAFTQVSKLKSGLHTCFIGGLAAFVAYSLARFFS